MTIYWHQLDWQAFATLATGLVAVAGAVWVGRRQAGISQRQAEIQSRQVSLAELALRSELFDRRWAVYDATRALLLQILQRGDEPDQEVTRAFLNALNTSEFLFKPEIKEGLSEIWQQSCSFFETVYDMRHLYNTTGTYGADNIEKKLAGFQWLNGALNTLGDMFGDELKLASPPTPRPPHPPPPPSPAGSAPRP